MLLGSSRRRTKVVASAGFLGFLFGGAAAGKVMIWLGMMKPGVTTTDRVLDHWTGFLTGAVLGWILCTTLALVLFYRINRPQ